MIVGWRVTKQFKITLAHCFKTVDACGSCVVTMNVMREAVEPVETSIIEMSLEIQKNLAFQRRGVELPQSAEEALTKYMNDLGYQYQHDAQHLGAIRILPSFKTKEDAR